MRYGPLPVSLMSIGICLAHGLAVARPAAPASGVAGDVTISPTCPGPTRIDRNCSGPFSGAKLELLNAEGRSVGSAVSNAEGRFEIRAAAGDYELTVKIDGMYPRCEVVPVQVKKKQITKSHIECDSGMR